MRRRHGGPAKGLGQACGAPALTRRGGQGDVSSSETWKDWQPIPDDRTRVKAGRPPVDIKNTRETKEEPTKVKPGAMTIGEKGLT